MLRAVIDTSSLVSYVLTRGDLMRRVVAHWRANGFVVLSSPTTRAELAAVLSRPQIQRLAVASLDSLIQGMERYTWHVPGVLDLAGACRDPKDDKFLACAVEGRCHYLVSSDKDLLDMKAYRGVAIVNPGQFLLALELHALDVKALVRRFDRETLVGIPQALPLEPETAARLLEAIALAADKG
jgi:uncharacterized protein